MSDILTLSADEELDRFSKGIKYPEAEEEAM